MSQPAPPSWMRVHSSLNLDIWVSTASRHNQVFVLLSCLFL